MPIGVAIIGSGIFVKEEHLPAVHASPELSLKAIYSRSLKSAQALSTTGIDLYSDDSGAGKTYHDLLLRDDIQAVIIALPILKQPEHVEAALAAGKHVLSEKPIAADIARAKKLIAYSKSDKVKGGATWAVAENFRFLESFEYGRQEIAKLGKVQGFSHKSFLYVKPGDKYFETPWRKKPEYQGGFLLDGGVHNIAAVRYLLGDAAQPAAVSAFTSLLQEHLPPVDTVNSIWAAKSGVSGTFSISFGTSNSGREYTIACEKGGVIVSGSTVKVWEGRLAEGKVSEKTFGEEGNGVKQEVKAWAAALAAGKPDAKQSAEEALADLEILEKMLKSGEQKGKTEHLELQI